MSEFTDETRNKLRDPFKPEQIGKKSKAKVDKSPNAKRCRMCGSKHEYPDVEAVHVDYVGHAIVTGRLNDVVGPGNWSYTIDQVIERDGHITGIVGTMTIAGRTIGQEVGTPAKADLWGEEFKTAISDYIRRAAMRFGVALDLWSKQELESGEVGERGVVRPGLEKAPGEGTSDSATIQAGPGGGRSRGVRNAPQASAATTSGSVAVGANPGPDQTPEPPASAPPGHEGGSGTKAAPQQGDRTGSSAAGAAANSKAFQEACKALGLDNNEAIKRLRAAGWALPQAWWKTIDGWTHDDLAKAIAYLEQGAEPPEKVKAS